MLVVVSEQLSVVSEWSVGSLLMTDDWELKTMSVSSNYGQATKGVRWMPWRQESMKDVASCDKLR